MAVNEKDTGFSVSEEQDCVIASGESVSAEIDLGRNYAFVCIGCDDMDGIDTTTTFTVQASPLREGTLRDMYGLNGGAIITTEILPAVDGDTYQTVFTSLFGMRRIQITLSKVTTAEVTFKIIGIDSGRG